MDIVVAEDSFAAREVLSAMIKNAGHKALIAENGMEAWELIRTKKARILITDWMMPELDGLDLCRKIREAEWPYYIYIILLTSMNLKSDLVKGLEAGADDYIIKPIDYEEMAARIRTAQRIIGLEENYRLMHAQLLQSDKMASIGQLASGIAHEINNPIGFISSNLSTLQDYQKDTISLLYEYGKLIEKFKTTDKETGERISLAERLERIVKMQSEIDIDFLLDDTPKLINECIEGTKRIKQIVVDLKDFAHPGESKLKYADINKNLDSTLNVVWNEIKYKADVKKEYSDLPLVRCYPQKLNQVFMNILVNAAQSIKDRGEIKIATLSEDNCIKIIIRDTGCGIPPENIPKIFDPFFTTKDVGKGTGLGLNVAYNIIKKHSGSIDVKSKVGEGTSFTISIPVEGIDEDI